MKQSVFQFLIATVLLLLPGCGRETGTLPDEVRYATVSLNLSQEGDEPGTRSLIPFSAENFRNAALFAFGSDGRILTYRYLDGQKTVAVEVTQKSFDWILPRATEMDIYVLVNYTSLAELGLSVSDPNLRKSDLDNLFHTCASVSAFSSLAERCLPMAGKVHLTVNGSEETIDIALRRLFARYDISFDAGSFQEKGYTLTSGSLKVRNCNTAVPYFTEGYRYTASSPGSLVSSLDELTDSQLLSLFDTSLPAEERTATLYVPENCQGNLGTASSWDLVYYELGADKMRYATYVEVSLKATKEGQANAFIYRIYLGKTDQKSNFDVPRNYHKKLELTLRPILPESAGEQPGASPFDGFLFLYNQANVEESGKYIELPFETNLAQSAISVSILSTDSDYLTVPADYIQRHGPNEYGNTRYAYSGILRLYAPEKSTNQLDRYVSVTGGIPGNPACSDETVVHIRHTRWITIDVTYDWDQEEYLLTASEALPCRVDLRVYIGNTSSPSVMFLEKGRRTNNFAMPPEGDPEIRSLVLYKLDGKTVPPYIYTTTNTEYHFVLSLEGSNFDDEE